MLAAQPNQEGVNEVEQFPCFSFNLNFTDIFEMFPHTGPVH